MISVGWSIFLLLAFILSFVATGILKKSRDTNLKEFGSFTSIIWKLSLPLMVVAFAMSCTVTIKPGHAGVGQMFGKVRSNHLKPGLHFANPFVDWIQFDCREKSYKDKVLVPSKDQLTTSFEISVQYKIDSSMTPKVLNETGNEEQLVNVHLVPKFRSLVREAGKSIERAEDFFLNSTQVSLQSVIYSGLKAYLAPKGIIILAILIRDIKLPPTIVQGVESKKKRDQEAEKEKSELKRFRTEQQKKVERAKAELEAAEKIAEKRKVLTVVKAKAELEAAESLAKKKMILADAKAYEIKKINDAIGNNPSYIKLEALKALKSMSKDPSSKFYFMDGKGTNPIPLMHFGEKK
jgi:prohibitin 1